MQVVYGRDYLWVIIFRSRSGGGEVCPFPVRINNECALAPHKRVGHHQRCDRCDGGFEVCNSGTRKEVAEHQ